MRHRGQGPAIIVNVCGYADDTYDARMTNIRKHLSRVLEQKLEVENTRQSQAVLALAGFLKG